MITRTLVAMLTLFSFSCSENFGSHTESFRSTALTRLQVQSSPNGTEVPPAPQIVDSSGNVWTVNGNTVVENGGNVGYSSGAKVLYINGVIYQENSNGNFWSWTDEAWAPFAGDPRSSIPVATPTPTPTPAPSATPTPAPQNSGSPNGTMVPPAAQIIDSSGNVWTVNGSVVVENGGNVGYSGGVKLLYYNGVVYQENSNGNFWSWTNNAWLSVSGDPRGSTQTPTPTPQPPPPTPTPTQSPTPNPTATPQSPTPTPQPTPTPGGTGSPAAATNVVAYPDVGGLDVFFKGPNMSGLSPLTKYTATAYNYPDGSPTGISASTLVQATTGALSNYVRLNGLTGGKQYTITVTATNANGTSKASAPSAPAIPKALTNYYIQNGNGRPGLPGNTGWATWGGGGLFDYASTAVTYNGEANSISMPPGSLILPYYLNTWNNYPGNGAFNTSPYTYCILKVYGSGFNGGPVSVSFRWAKFVFGYVWQGSSSSIDDNTQSYSANGLQNGAASMQPFGGSMAYNAGSISNAGNLISGIGGGFNWAGVNQYLWSQGDVDFNDGSTNPAPGVAGIEPYVTYPSAGKFTSNQWNTVAIPLSATNIASGIPSAHANGWIPGSIQEIRVYNGNGSTIYITDLGFQ